MLNKHVSADSCKSSAQAEISALAEDICQQQFPHSSELNWQTFTPDADYDDRASQLLSSLENEPLFTWENSNASLYLNFWKKTAENVKFLLFYSSPELELSNYISTHPFDTSSIEMVIDAWQIRTRAMLAFFMHNRDRSLLLNVQSANSENESFVQVLNQQFDLDLEPKPLTSASLKNNSVLIEYLATTLLLNSQQVSELYDEVRSAATLISDRDTSISSIEARNTALVDAFLAEVSVYSHLRDTRSALEDELATNQLQINQMSEELEHYFKNSIEQEKIAKTMLDYLSNDPLLKIARQARQIK